jgi:hypothetical protein
MHGPLFIDDFVKSPASVLRCILRHCDVLSVRLIPEDWRALNLELFTLPSSLDFLRAYYLLATRKKRHMCLSGCALFRTGTGFVLDVSQF